MEGGTLLIARYYLWRCRLKHLGGYCPGDYRIVGPVHGLAFLYFMWVLSRAASEEGWRLRVAVMALLPASSPALSVDSSLPGG